MKFKSNGTKSKQSLEQIQNTQEAKKKTGMNFPGNRMRDGFSWNQTEVAKKENSRNNMIRLVPTRIESGRGK